MQNLQELKEAVGNLNEEKVVSILDDFLNESPTKEEAQEVITGCQKGMDVVGEKYESGEYFVGDLIYAGELLTNVVDKLKPVLGDDDDSRELAVMLLGTVKGDLHDIGKNIFKNMAEASGFKVYDIGVDQSPDDFIEAVEDKKPDIIGLSGLLTVALESMEKTVNDMQKAGLREGVKIIIGGNAVTQESFERIGADAFTKNASEGIKICKGWVK